MRLRRRSQATDVRLLVRFEEEIPGQPESSILLSLSSILSSGADHVSHVSHRIPYVSTRQQMRPQATEEAVTLWAVQTSAVDTPEVMCVALGTPVSCGEASDFRSEVKRMRDTSSRRV